MTFHYLPRRLLASAPSFIALVIATSALTAQANPISRPSAGSLGNQLNQDSTQRLPSKRIDDPLQNEVAEPSADSQDAVATVRLEHVRFIGAEVFSEDELQRIVMPWTQRDVTMAQLYEMMRAVEFAYHQRGYLAVGVALPVQNMQDGVLEVLVTVGRYEKPVVTTQTPRELPFLSGLVERVTCDQACDGQRLIESAQVDRALYLLNDLPGISARGNLKAGSLPGTSLLEVSVAPIKRLGGYVELNNHGNQFTGEEVLSTGAQLNSSWFTGDQLTLDAVSSLEALQHTTGLQQLSASYSLPVGAFGTRLGGGYSHLEYRLNQEFRTVDAHGKSDSANAWIKHPLWLSHRGRTDVRLVYEQSRYADSYNRLYKPERDVDATTLELSGNLYGDRQITGWRLSSTLGSLKYGLPSDQEFDRLTRKSAGSFARHRLDAFALKGLDYNWELYGAFRGQMASRNLDSSQGFVMGGPNAVRAFGTNSPTVDEGWQGSLELRHVNQTLGMQWTAAGFYDVAQGRVNRHPWGKGTDTQLRLSGAGGYLGATFLRQYNVRLTYAQRLQDNLDADIDSSQLWLSLSTVF